MPTIATIAAVWPSPLIGKQLHKRHGTITTVSSTNMNSLKVNKLLCLQIIKKCIAVIIAMIFKDN